MIKLWIKFQYFYILPGKPRKQVLPTDLKFKSHTERYENTPEFCILQSLLRRNTRKQNQHPHTQMITIDRIDFAGYQCHRYSIGNTANGS
jgi:hypothetical protein